MIDIQLRSIQSIDERRSILIAGNTEETIDYCAEHFVLHAIKWIRKKDRFAVALSGGSTPKAIFQKISKSPLKKRIDWEKVFLFWSDERSVAPSHPESNFAMAMESGLRDLGILSKHIFRMKADKAIEKNALEYEKQIQQNLGKDLFDLVMLGMGDDGHTASLFPSTAALNEKNRLVVANYIPQKNTWRMTLSFSCINQSQNIVVYVLGENKQDRLCEIFTKPFPQKYPIERIGTKNTKALFIVDTEAAKKIT